MVSDGGRPLLEHRIGGNPGDCFGQSDQKRRRRQREWGASRRTAVLPENGCLIEMSSWRYLCVCLYNPAATLRNEICEAIPLWLRARDRGRRCEPRLSVRSQSGFSMLTIVRVLKLDLLLNRMARRTVSSTSTLQHSHTSAVRRCAAVVKEMPSPPPSASQAAIHMGHFGTSASAMLGNAKAAAPRVRRTARLCRIGPAGT